MSNQEGETGITQPLGGAPIEAGTVDPWTAFIAPGDVFRCPREVLAHPALSYWEKRAILASWASDVHAAESCPTHRSLPGRKAETVPVTAVLEALAELDAGNHAIESRPRPAEPVRRGLRSAASLYRRLRPRRRDGDDDPPPCPAGAMPRPRPPAPLIEAVGRRVPCAA